MYASLAVLDPDIRKDGLFEISATEATFIPGSTLAAIGGIRPSNHFEFSLNDARLGRTLIDGRVVLATTRRLLLIKSSAKNSAMSKPLRTRPRRVQLPFLLRRIGFVRYMPRFQRRPRKSCEPLRFLGGADITINFSISPRIGFGHGRPNSHQYPRFCRSFD